MDIDHEPLIELAELMGKPLTVFDLETTTLRGRANFGLTEVAGVTYEPDGSSETWGSLLDPECPISQEAQDLTGITPDMVKGQPRWAPQYADAFLGMAKAHVICGFNIAAFDVPAVKDMCVRYFAATPSFKAVLDVRTTFNRLEPEESGGSLAEVASKLGIQAPEGLHRAQADVALCCAVLAALTRKHGARVLLEASGLLKPSKAEGPAILAREVDNPKLLAYLARHPYQGTEALARALNGHASILSFQLSTLLDRGEVSFDTVALEPARLWLADQLKSVDVAKADGKLKPLYEELRARCPNDVPFDYVQLRVGLRDAGHRWNTLQIA